MAESKGPLNELWNWVKGHIVQDAPERLEICEFDCRKDQCTMREWENCERRKKKAAGELMPEEEDAYRKNGPPAA